jgi:hypothetical protein
MAENDAKKKQKMMGSATDHHQKEGDSDDSVNQADPGDSSIMKEDDPKENLKMMSSISYHLQKDGGDDSSRLALMNAINSTPKKRKEPTTTTETPSKIRKEDGGNDPSRLALKNEGDPSDGDATGLMNAIISTPKKRKEPTTTAESPSKKRKEERQTGPSKTAIAQTVKRFHKMNVKV